MGFVSRVISGVVIGAVALGTIGGASETASAASAAEPAESVTVSGRVFDDANINGIFDDSEPVFPGLSLRIEDQAGTQIPDPADPAKPWIITTGTDGTYSWQVPSLPFPGYQYSVVLLNVPEGLQGNGGWELPDGGYGLVTTKDLDVAGAVDDTVNFALTAKAVPRGPVVFGGAVWDDTDRDGVRDAGEPGFPGLLVGVRDGEGSPLDDPGNPGQPLETVTEDDGSYRFDTMPYLDDGFFYSTYLASAPAGYYPTSGQVTDEFGGYTQTGTIPLTTEGATDLGIGFGFAKTAGVTVGGAVYVDADHDGTRDEFERPLPDLTVTLHRTDGAPINGADGMPVTASTDDTGAYRFPELPLLQVGEGYRVVLDRMPEGYESTIGLTPAGAGLQRDSTSDLSTAGATDTGIDFPLGQSTGPGSDGDWLVMPYLHIDVFHPELDTAPDGSQTLALRAHIDGRGKSVDWNNAVVPHTDKVKYTLPAVNTPEADYSFIGEPGSTYWDSPFGGSILNGSPWIGWSTQSDTLNTLPLNHPFVFRLDAVLGHDGGEAPGDVVLWESMAGNKPLPPRMSTRQELPQAYTFGRGKHAHMHWSFTAPGVYCMAVSVHTDMPDGTRKEAHGFLTQVVGSAFDPAKTEPCGRSLTYPTPTPPVQVDSPDPAPVLRDGTSRSRIAVGVQDGALSATFDRISDRSVGPAVSSSIDDVIVQTAPEALANRNYALASAGWNTLRIPENAIQGDLEWSLDRVRGPGEVTWTSQSEYDAHQFDTKTGVTTRSMPTNTNSGGGIRVSRPGVYCVDMSWSATTATGKAVSASHTLTLVVDGSLDPDGYDPFWKENGKDGPFTGPVWRGAEHGALEKTCAQGAVPTRADEVPVPGDGPDPETPVWQVPNGSRTDSGAIILNNGHVDVASTLEGGVFDTQIKDTTAEGVANATRDGASWHDPSKAVIQVLPGAETRVPQGEAYRFLGAAGAPVWVVTETQQDDLVWPGWSTEAIPLTATTTGVDWRLDRVSGPGEFALSKGGAGLGSVDVLMNTRDGVTSADAVTIPKHSHVHGDWAFSAEGTYCLAFTRSTTLPTGASPSDSFTLAVAVGKVSVKKINPAACFTTTGQPTDPDTVPVPESQLTDATNGGVQIFGNDQAFLAGQLMTVKTGTAPAGSWVSLWVHSTGTAPVWAGWAQVTSAGAAQVRLPATLSVGSHKLVVKNAGRVLIGWDVFTTVAPPQTPPTPDSGNGGGGGAVPVAAAQCTPSNVTVIGAGHLDWNAQLVAGKLESLVGDDSTGTRVYRDPASTVLWLKPASKLTLPGGYGQVGPAGTVVWQNPQTQNQDLIWLGWSTELLNAGNASSPVSWSLDSVDGPGTVKVYTTSSFGGVQQMFFDGGGSYRIPLGVHAHANWAFTDQGIYRLRFTQSVTLPSGQVSTDTETLTIAVGDVNPNTAISSGSGCGVVSTAIRTGTTPLADAAKAAAQAQAEAAAAAAGILPGGARQHPRHPHRGNRCPVRGSRGREPGAVAVEHPRHPPAAGCGRVRGGVVATAHPETVRMSTLDRVHPPVPYRRVHPSARYRRWSAVAALLVGVVGVSGCASKPLLSAEGDRLQVVTTTGLLRNLVQNVGGDRVDVASIVPNGADPHTYEPTLRDARNVVYADVAFSNYALLEEHHVIKTLDSNLHPGAVNVSLAEEAVKYAAEIIPLVENVNLDTVWLGLRAHGDGAARYGATRTSEVLLSATGATGPGEVFAYLTGTFGDTDVYFDSADGFDASTGYRDDTMSLPADAHTHLSWAFTMPGIYTVTLAARVQVDDTSRPQELGQATFTFAVGVNPADAGVPDAVVLDQGHADLTANLQDGALEVRYDPGGGGEHTQTAYTPDQIVIDVPAKALSEIPRGSQFSFLGRAGTQVYQLPQAVLGKHVHGEIDPHLWQNVRNAMAYVQLIRDTLIAADPTGARDYTENAAAYLTELEGVDAYVRDQVARIPEANRYLITTHDAFGYLAEAYHVQIAGFVTPHPASEPSLADRRKLSETLRTLRIPAVFLEPNNIGRSNVLTELAAEQHVRVCSIYGDALDDRVPTYVDMMRFNADSLRTCLTG